MRLLVRGLLALVVWMAVGRVHAVAPRLFSSLPRDASLQEGAVGELYVMVLDGDALTYQWQKEGTPIAGATGSRLSFNPVRTSDAGTYSCIVSNAEGTATSRTATVSLTPATPITITEQPSDRSVYETQSTTFYVYFTGSPTVTYQWRKDGVAIPGATFGNTFTVNRVTAADAGDYSVILTNAAGQVTSRAARLTVLPTPKPVFTTQPMDVVATEGTHFTINTATEDTGSVSYAWYQNGVAIPYESSSWIAFGPVDWAHAGTYHVVATNSAGSTTSNEVTLTVLPPEVPATARLRRATVRAGDHATLSTHTPQSFPSTTAFQWFRNGELLPGATASTLAITNATAADAGDYVMSVSNASGATPSLAARLTVLAPRDTASAAWFASRRHGDTVYFAFKEPARIERFDLAADTWLTPVPLSSTPTAFAVSADALFVAAGPAITRYPFDGSGSATFGPALTTRITALETMGDYLVALEAEEFQSTFTSIRLTDGAKASSAAIGLRSYYEMIATSPTRLIARETWNSSHSSRIVTVGADGTFMFGSWTYWGVYRSGRRTVASPGGKYVADISGVVEETTALDFAAALGSESDDIAFITDDHLVALRGGVAHVYDHLLESRRIDVGLLGTRVYVRGDDITVFGGAVVDGVIPRARVSLASASAPEAASPLNPRGLGFTPDSAFVDKVGVVHLLSKMQRQLFRWSTGEGKLLDPIPLQGFANHVAYSDVTDRIYIAYGDGRVTQVRRDAGSVNEEPFFTSLEQTDALTTGGEFVVLTDSQGASSEKWTYVVDPSGTVTARTRSLEAGLNAVWSPSTRRLYHFTDSVTPSRLVYETMSSAGALGQTKEWPYWGSNVELTRHPIEVSPDGALVVLGSGHVYDATTLSLRSFGLANTIEAAEWLASGLFTGRTLDGNTEIQRWNSVGLGLEAAKIVPGRLFRFVSTPDGRLVVLTLKGGFTHLTTFDASLAQVHTTSFGAADRMANLSCRSFAGTGDESLIVGLTVGGTASKSVLIRAAGPALPPFGVNGAIADPTLVVRNAAGIVVGENDNWGDAANVTDVSAATSRTGAFPFAGGSGDAAVLLDLPPGSYTAQVDGVGGATGVALVEAYDVSDDTSPAQIVNLATRAHVGAGSDVLIAGLVIQGGAPKRVLVRGIGPRLADYGVGGTLANPKLQVYRGSVLVAANDNWQSPLGSSPARLVNAASALTGAFSLPDASKDAALFLTLHPGSYSFVVSGVDEATGAGMIEVYQVGE